MDGSIYALRSTSAEASSAQSLEKITSRDKFGLMKRSRVNNTGKAGQLEGNGIPCAWHERSPGPSEGWWCGGGGGGAGGTLNHTHMFPGWL